MDLKYLIFCILATVGCVKSDCDTYIECLGSFFDNLFKNNNNFTVNDTKSDIVIPEFDNVNIKNDLYNILSGVSGFLKEELLTSYQFGTPVNVFRNVSNDTAIYVKTIIITDDLDHIDFENIEEDSVLKEFNLNDTLLNIESENETQEISRNANNTVNYETKTNNSIHIEKLNKKIHENEIPDTDYVIYNDIDDNSTDYPVIDYLELYKDTTNEYIELETTTIRNEEGELNLNVLENRNNDIYIAENCTANTNFSQLLFPWVAAIFIKNDSSQQFDYYCDGAVISHNVVVTAARCLQYYGTWKEPEDIIVLFGKTSLNIMNENERAVKVNKVIVHENFTMSPENDIAILVMEEAVESQTACLGQVALDHSYTTGWAVSGELTLIPFDSEKTSKCGVTKNTSYCAVYNDDVTVCPSYGGIHVARQANTHIWYLRGIRHADPTDRSFCVNHTITYTDLTYYSDWIMQYVE